MSFLNFPITADGQSTPLAGGGNGGASVRIQITGTWTGTVTFQSTVDGTNFTATNVRPVGQADANTTAVTTATAVGQWIMNARGAAGVRVTATAAITGTALVSITNANS